MRKLSGVNVKKTLYYLRRNGLRNTWDAAMERMAAKDDYRYEAPSAEVLERQRAETLERANSSEQGEEAVAFSIVVPLYRTDPAYLRALSDSVRAQSYPAWELILADATENDSVKKIVQEILEQTGEDGGRIRYVQLPENEGISGNTNHALTYAQNPYVGLLDHDDLLTPDALYEMAAVIRRGREQGRELAIIYSDEDKCDSAGIRFYEPNRKEDFNYDLLLSNNYICHFLVMKRELIQSLGFRPEYDGAQDYDLILRAVESLGIPKEVSGERLVGHVAKVLYHWRCHEASTAENPQSKTYAYEAGKRALQDHLDKCGIRGQVRHMKHLGFYEIAYPGGELACRDDLGAVGGVLTRKGRIVGGRMNKAGKVFYKGLPVRYSGYLHRAVLAQDAKAVDIRNIKLRRELWGLFEEIAGVPYTCRSGELVFDSDILPENADYTELSLRLCKEIRKRGYRILWKRGNERRK